MTATATPTAELDHRPICGEENIPGDAAGDARYTLHWEFTKTCSMGGTSC